MKKKEDQEQRSRSPYTVSQPRVQNEDAFEFGSVCRWRSYTSHDH